MIAKSFRFIRPEQLLNFGSSKRLPMIVQTEVAECGLACLGMIAGYYGYDTDLMHLRQHYKISSKGASLRGIMDIAVQMHLNPRALRVESEDLGQLLLPCIIHWGLNHFVVLKDITQKKYVLHDPAFGERVIERSEFNKEFTGVVLELTPTQEFKKREDKDELTLGHFWSNIIGLKRSLAHVIALSFMLQVFAVATPFYMQTVVDDVLLRKDSNLLLVLALGFGLLILIQVGTTTVRQFLLLHMSNRLGIQMSANLFRHLIRLPMDFFGKRHMGDVVSRFGSLTKVRELLTTSLVSAVIDGVMAIITLIAMFFYSVKLTSIVIGIVTIYGLVRWIFFRPFRSLSEESMIASAKESTHFMESIRAIQTIKIFQKESDRQQQWQNRLAAVMNKNILIAKWGIGYDATSGLLFGLENLVIIYLAASAVMDSMISLGMLYAFMSYKARFITSMDNLISKSIELKMLSLHLSRLADIAFTPIEDIDNNIEFEQPNLKYAGNVIPFNASQSYKISGKIEVRNLAYRYSDQEPYIFRNLNFIILPGETVAITGESGCGKTTLLKCLMGLISPSQGEIFIDDRPLSEQRCYRSQIVGVMQEDKLLSGDINENISCFSQNMNLEKVQQCAQLACIHNDIVKMPMQYHTLVGDMGSNMSGGQKQRILMARALYRDPRILFMDEATSHLDVDNESLVSANIKRLDITRVLIAHRPETVKTAGRQINLPSHGEM